MCVDGHSFEKVLLGNMLSIHPTSKELEMTATSRFPWLRTWMAALALIAAASILTWRLGEFHLISALADALFVAGLLTLLVEPLFRREFLAEASRGIFIHLLGFEHRPEVKEKLKEIVFNTKVLRKNFDVRCAVEPRDGYFEATVEYDSEIINPTHAPAEFTPYVEFDMAKKVEILSLSFTSSDGKCKWHGVPKREELEPGVETFRARTFSVQPESKGVTYRGNCRYRILLRHGYEMFYMAVPTLHMTLRASAPDDYEVSATPATVDNVGYWQYDAIQMVGDHVTVRWRKRGGDWL